MPSSEDSAAHNPSRVSIDNGRLQETHKFSTVKHEITAKNMYTHIYRCAELYAEMQHDDDFKAMITMMIFSIELSCEYISHSYR